MPKLSVCEDARTEGWLIDNQCQSHLFFQALHPTYARSNVVHMKQGDEWIVDPSTIIDICVHYFKALIGP